jgi:hypothetical protein
VSCVVLRGLAVAALSVVLFFLAVGPEEDSGPQLVQYRRQYLSGAQECGPACIDFLVQALGWRNRWQEIPEPFCHHPCGWSLRELSDAVTAMGWASVREQGDWQDVRRCIDRRDRAAILHVNGGHFLLVFGGPLGDLSLFDPATGEVVAIASLPPRYRWDGVMLRVQSAN